MVSPPIDRSRGDKAGLRGTMMGGVTEEGMFKGQISSRELGMVGGVRDEGSNVLWREGTSGTRPRLPDYFRKLTEHPVGKRAPSGSWEMPTGG